MREFMAITKALSDPSRVRILLALRRRELCVCQITELFGFHHVQTPFHPASRRFDSVSQVGALGLLPVA
jgi:hypothetical protein